MTALLLGDQHDYSRYPKRIIKGKEYHAIPLSDILPPDFEDVMLETKAAGNLIGYYSPARNKIQAADYATTGREFKMSRSDVWFRACK